MIDINELRRLAQAVSGWSNCNQAWLDQSEDAPAAVVGHIDEDGNTYPIATIDCYQYYAAHQSLPLAKFYAAANPAAISELLDRLEADEKAAAEAYQRGYATGQEEIEKERDALRAKVQAMEKQEPVAWARKLGLDVPSFGCVTDLKYRPSDIPESSYIPLYALPGAKGEEK